jgi:hypothetical protein
MAGGRCAPRVEPRRAAAGGGSERFALEEPMIEQRRLERPWMAEEI